MRKVWQTRRKDGKGVNVQWFDDSGRRRTKFFAPQYKGYIKRFMAAKFLELNGDLRMPGDIISVPWQTLCDSYIDHEEAGGCKPKTIRELKSLLRRLGDAIHCQYSKHLMQSDLDRYLIARRQSGVSPHTVNKNIREISAFFRFC